MLDGLRHNIDGPGLRDSETQHCPFGNSET